MTNKQIARTLKLTADLVELTGGNPFRARAFASAARGVERLHEPVAQHVAAGTLTDVPGIGKGIAKDVEEIAATGRLGAAETLLAALPPGLPDVLRVKGLGVKKVRALWTEAGVTSLDELEHAAASGQLDGLAGFGAKTVQNILEAVEQLRSYHGKAHLRDAVADAAAVRDALRGAGLDAEVVGAVRRQCNVVDRIEVVAAAEAAAARAALDALRMAFDAGDTAEADAAEADSAEADAAGRALTGRTEAGLPVTVHLAPTAFGRAVWERTGPEAHVEAVRARVAGPLPDAEAAIYAAAGLAVVPPCLRDDPHWTEAAAAGPLPALVETADLRGTVHNHTTASDGAHSLREMCDAARARGLGYFGVCDHSQSLRVANGLAPAALAAQRHEVDALNDHYAGAFRVFAGSEVDILADGRMDYDDEILDGLDLVVASVHTGFAMSEDEATARVVRAVRNPYVDVLGHPTGRLLLRREGYPLDHAAVLDACAEARVAVELNANPWRLDVDWTFVRAARARGVLVAINPDAHAMEGLDDVRWGVASAQKGGLTPDGSLTCLDADAFAAWHAARRD